MKSVAAHAFGIKPLRDRIMVSDRMMAAVKRGIEACDLGNSGHAVKQDTNWGQVVWLMERCKRRIPLKSRKNALINEYRSIVFRPAMHHAVANGGRLDLLRFAQPRACGLERCGDILELLGRVGLVDQLLFVGSLSAQPRLRADGVNLPLKQTMRPGGAGCEHLEFDAR